ncbi:hypothetical protein DFH27DRAFT_298531 [Peziza echinospora]|nr:hypothetical protein DFH27DRAFT_298531 [Peziza echinospora]
MASDAPPNQVRNNEQQTPPSKAASRNQSSSNVAAAPSSGSGSSSAIDGITSSASSLLRSFLQPSPGEVASASRGINPSKGQQQQSIPSSSSYSGSQAYYQEDTVAGRAPQNFAASDKAQLDGFRTATESETYTGNAEFQDFTFTASSMMPNPELGLALRQPDAPPPPEDIMSVLSGSLTQDVWQLEPLQDPVPLAPSGRPNTYNPYFESFLMCDDIVEFLSRGESLYTEEVWGDMLGMVQEARQEIEDSKGKGKEDARDSALERLRMIHGQLKSKL